MRMIDMDTRRPSSDPSPWMPFESRRRAPDEKREAVLRTALQSFLDPRDLSEKNRKIMRASKKSVDLTFRRYITEGIADGRDQRSHQPFRAGAFGRGSSDLAVNAGSNRSSHPNIPLRRARIDGDIARHRGESTAVARPSGSRSCSTRQMFNAVGPIKNFFNSPCGE
jgi:hypothetical protein